jgi:hypothetical protein
MRPLPPALQFAAACGFLVLFSDVAAGGPPAGPGPGKKGENEPAPALWALKPISDPEPPPVRDPSWCRNPIDRFVLARLEEEGLRPSPEADPVTLIRRLSLDLIGLPPSPEEVDRFLAGGGASACERLVDRLLASPHYGERWGRQWLDIARYADTNGFEKDNVRTMWRYRDWVIEALNRDLGFDRFITEQLAGDLLPDPTPSQLVATGFHRNTMINDEGGVDQEQYRYLAVVDRVNTTAGAFLGLTLGCAQCHSHKYDPLSQREYFQFFAFFNNADEPVVEMPTPEEEARRASHREALERARSELLLDTAPGREDLYREVNAAQPLWEKEKAREARRWVVLDPRSFTSEGNASLEKLPDRSLLAGGPSPGSDTYRVEAVSELPEITAIRLEVLPHPSLPHGGPGRGRVLGEGNFVLSELSVAAAPLSPSSGDSSRPVPLVLKNASADHSQKGFEVANAIDGDVETGWSIGSDKPGMNVARAAVFETEGPALFRGPTRLTFTLTHHYVHEHNIGRFRLSVTGGPRPVKATGLTPEAEEALTTPEEGRTESQRAAIRRQYRLQAPRLADLQKKLAELGAVEVPVTTALVMRERARPRTTRLHIRGEFLNEGEEVSPAVPACLPPLPPGPPANRLGLARWLSSPENPLTARVTVNRAWLSHFGRALVNTPEDFGSRGEPPSHPALLDWLARELQRQSWSLKALHRLIVSSAAYRQSSVVGPELLQRDPYNVLLARGPRFRLEAELVRDVALCAGGLLSAKVGGPSVFPPQPEGVNGLSYGSFEWKSSTGEDRYRRGLYTFWKRTSPYPALLTLDAPTADTTCLRRSRTNTPLQSLTLLNDAVFLEAAQGLARRTFAEGPEETEGRVRLAFRLCLSRSPDPVELEELTRFVERERRRFKERAAEAALLFPADPARRPAGIALEEAAAWTLLARVLLNLDETITLE